MFILFHRDKNCVTSFWNVKAIKPFHIKKIQMHMNVK